MVWLPNIVYHAIPWIYFALAGACMLFGKGNLFFELLALILGLLGVYVLFMRFVYGNADQDKW